MRDPESAFSVIRSCRFTPGMLWMIETEAKRLRMTFSSYIRYVATTSIRRAHQEPA